MEDLGMKRIFLRTILGFVLSIYFSCIAFAAAGWTETDNGWVFYNEDGTVKSNSWEKSGYYWYYLNSDGSIAKDAIVESDGEKYYVDATGKMVANTWISSGDNYYFAGEEGKFFKAATVNETIVKKIDGAYYTFGFDGKWIVQALLKTGVNDSVYTNADLRYSVKIPSKAKYDIDKNHIKIEGDLYFVQIINYPMSGESMEEIATTAEKWYNEWVDAAPASCSKISEKDVRIGEYNLRKTHKLEKDGSMGVDNYLCIQENGFFIISTAYYKYRTDNVENILNSLTMNK